MGGDQSYLAKKYGNIIVQTKDASYTAGDLVTGSVYVNFHEAFPASTIFLKLMGMGSNFKKKNVDGENQLTEMGIPVLLYGDAEKRSFSITSIQFSTLRNP